MWLDYNTHMAHTPSPARDPSPDDIQPGQPQFLRYPAGIVRGSWNGKGSVSIAWDTGYFTTCGVDEWNSREFLNEPQRARLMGPDEYPQANAWFFQVQQRIIKVRTARN